MELFDRNKRTIKSIYEDFNKGVLTVDASYQRRHVWLLQDKVRLIETILMGLIVPEVFFWPATVDPETGNMLTHIVDGQQRIDAIVDFIDGKYDVLLCTTIIESGIDIPAVMKELTQRMESIPQ